MLALYSWKTPGGLRKLYGIMEYWDFTQADRCVQGKQHIHYLICLASAMTSSLALEVGTFSQCFCSSDGSCTWPHCIVSPGVGWVTHQIRENAFPPAILEFRELKLCSIIYQFKVKQSGGKVLKRRYFFAIVWWEIHICNIKDLLANSIFCCENLKIAFDSIFCPQNILAGCVWSWVRHLISKYRFLFAPLSFLSSLYSSSVWMMHASFASSLVYRQIYVQFTYLTSLNRGWHTVFGKVPKSSYFRLRGLCGLCHKSIIV